MNDAITFVLSPQEQADVLRLLARSRDSAAAPWYVAVRRHVEALVVLLDEAPRASGGIESGVKFLEEGTAGLDVTCPYCGQPPGEWCRTRSDRPAPSHKVRPLVSDTRTRVESLLAGNRTAEPSWARNLLPGNRTSAVPP